MNKAELGERVKIIRKHFGLSQAQFAQKINRSPGFISNVETGRSEISESTVHSVCTAFGINKSWLIEGSGEMFADGREVAEADKDTIGPRIRMLRKREKLTQEQFVCRNSPCQAPLKKNKLSKIFINKNRDI